MHTIYINPLALEMDICSLSHHLCKDVNILRTKKGNIRKYTTFCERINEDGDRKSKNIIKYIIIIIIIMFLKS